MSTRDTIHASIAVALLLHSIAAGATEVIYGNVDDLGSASNGSSTENTLLGVPIEVASEFTLTDVGILAKTSGFNCRVGIYTDSGGAPGSALR